MELVDKDLASVQQVRQLLSQAKKASEALGKMSQEKIDKITEAISRAAGRHAALPCLQSLPAKKQALEKLG